MGEKGKVCHYSTLPGSNKGLFSELLIFKSYYRFCFQQSEEITEEAGLIGKVLEKILKEVDEKVGDDKSSEEQQEKISHGKERLLQEQGSLMRTAPRQQQPQEQSAGREETQREESRETEQHNQEVENEKRRGIYFVISVITIIVFVIIFNMVMNFTNK